MKKLAVLSCAALLILIGLVIGAPGAVGSHLGLDYWLHCKGVPVVCSEETPPPATTTEPTTTTTTAPPPMGEVANLWIDADGGSCVRSATPSNYVSGTACGTMTGAHIAASTGDAVRIKTVIMGQETLTQMKGMVQFLSADAATPRWTRITLGRGVSNINFDGFAIDTFMSAKCAGIESSCTGGRNRSIGFTNMKLRTFELTFVDGVSMVGGDVSPGGRCSFAHPLVATDVNSAATWAPKNITFDRVFFHDAIHQASCGNTECLYVWAGDGITVKNSTFRNCFSTGSMYITMLNAANYNAYCTGIVIENNFFYGHDDGSVEYVHFESDCEILVRHNTFSRGARLLALNSGHGGETVRIRPVTIVGNYGNNPAIKDGAACTLTTDAFTFVRNVWRGGTCDASDLNVSAFQVVNQAIDLHLVAGSNAIDRGSVGNFPLTDWDGQNRTGIPDAGGDERG